VLSTARKAERRDTSEIMSLDASFPAFRPDSAIRGEKKAL